MTKTVKILVAIGIVLCVGIGILCFVVPSESKSNSTVEIFDREKDVVYPTSYTSNNNVDSNSVEETIPEEIKSRNKSGVENYSDSTSVKWTLKADNLYLSGAETLKYDDSVESEAMGTINKLYISKDVKNIEDDFLDKFYRLREIEIEAGNKNYKSIDGALYSADSKKLIYIPARCISVKSHEFKIADKTETFDENLFQEDIREEVTTLVIPDSMSVETLLEIFSDETCIKELKCYPNSKIYSSKDGALLSKDGSVLYALPTGRRGVFKVPDGVKKVEPTLEHIKYVKELTIPASVTELNLEDFLLECKYLQRLQIDKNNKTYSAVKGIIYNKDMTELIRCPHAIAGTIVVPNSVKSIAKYAFFDTSANRIILPEGLKTISTRAFAKAQNLISVNIPSSVNKIGEYAFGYYNDNCVISVSSRSSAPSGWDENWYSSGIFFTGEKAIVKWNA